MGTWCKCACWGRGWKQTNCASNSCSFSIGKIYIMGNLQSKLWRWLPPIQLCSIKCINSIQSFLTKDAIFFQYKKLVISISYWNMMIPFHHTAVKTKELCQDGKTWEIRLLILSSLSFSFSVTAPQHYPKMQWSESAMKI